MLYMAIPTVYRYSRKKLMHILLCTCYRAREKRLEKEIHEASQAKVTQVYVVMLHCRKWFDRHLIL